MNCTEALPFYPFRAAEKNPLKPPGTTVWKAVFPWTGSGDGFRMIQAHFTVSTMITSAPPVIIRH